MGEMNLRECPFCGEAPEIELRIFEKGRCQIYCHGCALLMPSDGKFKSIKAAELAWNKRHNDEFAKVGKVYLEYINE